MMTMAACSGRRQGQKRWESTLFAPCFYNFHFQGSQQVEPACVCADGSVEQTRPSKWRQGWKERGLQHFQQVATLSQIKKYKINQQSSSGCLANHAGSVSGKGLAYGATPAPLVRVVAGLLKGQPSSPPPQGQPSLRVEAP